MLNFTVLIIPFSVVLYLVVQQLDLVLNIASILERI